ncbi:hypothetical protein [Sagittula sp. S175]|uniref:hypothetical protein n=1 Tax=Sagittula sp. S175 TaxID=3415129 RepID=UPI003C7CB901
MMRPILSALLLVALSALPWGLLLLAFLIFPDLGVKFYPRYTQPLAALLPMFASTPVSRFLRNGRTTMPGARELVPFMVLSILLAGALAYLVEALLCYIIYTQAQPIALTEILFSPWAKRYSVTTLFGLSFFTSATAVVAYTAILRTPGRMVHDLKAGGHWPRRQAT